MSESCFLDFGRVWNGWGKEITGAVIVQCRPIQYRHRLSVKIDDYPWFLFWLFLLYVLYVLVSFTILITSHLATMTSSRCIVVTLLLNRYRERLFERKFCASVNSAHYCICMYVQVPVCLYGWKTIIYNCLYRYEKHIIARERKKACTHTYACTRIHCFAFERF